MFGPVALSPSTQSWNLYTGGGNEEYYNWLIVNETARLLRARDVEVDIMTAGRGNSRDGYMANALQSNRMGKNYRAYVAKHTDAGGAVGTTAFYYSPDPTSRRLAQCIYDEMTPISPDPDHGVRPGDGYAEVNVPLAPSALIEAAAHDRAHTAEWIRNNWRQIARAYARGILRFLGLAVDTPAQTIPKPKLQTEPDEPTIEEMIDMNSGVYFEDGKDTWVYAVFNTYSGWYHTYTNGTGKGPIGGGYNNPLAATFRTMSYALVTKSHWLNIKKGLDLLRTRNVELAGTVNVGTES